MAGRGRGNGEGSVFYEKRRKVWIARFSYRLNGKLKQKSYSGSTKLQALRRMEEGRRNFDASSLTSEHLTLEGYLKGWLQSLQRNVADASYRRNSQDVRKHIIPCLGRVQLLKLKPAHVEQFKTSLQQKDLAASTINKCLDTLRAALNQAVHLELLTRNPAAGLKRVKDDAEDMICLSEAEAKKLIDVASEPKWRAMYLVAVKLGLRQGELLALKWEDIQGQELTVRGSVDTTLAKPVWGPTKGRANRSIILPQSVSEALAKHRVQQAEDRLQSLAWRDKGLVFPNESGGVQRAFSVRNQFYKDLEEAGLSRIRWHDLRDTAATLMLMQGNQLHEVSAILGHKDPAMTLRRYAHVLPNQKERLAESMDALIF